MQAKIIFNGKDYSSLDEMPPEARQAYEQMMNVLADRNQDGMPDLFEGLASLQNTLSVNAIHVDGQTYNSLDESRRKHARPTTRRWAPWPTVIGTASPTCSKAPG